MALNRKPALLFWEERETPEHHVLVAPQDVPVHVPVEGRFQSNEVKFWVFLKFLHLLSTVNSGQAFKVDEHGERRSICLLPPQLLAK